MRFRIIKVSPITVSIVRWIQAWYSYGLRFRHKFNLCIIIILYCINNCLHVEGLLLCHGSECTAYGWDAAVLRWWLLLRYHGDCCSEVKAVSVGILFSLFYFHWSATAVAYDDDCCLCLFFALLRYDSDCCFVVKVVSVSVLVIY